MIHATCAPVFGTLRMPGRDVEHNDFDLKAARVKIGFSTILRSLVLLPLYLGCLILVSDSQHILMPWIFPYRHLDLPSVFWMGKTAVATAASKSWEILGETGEYDPDIWPSSFPNWFKRIKGQTPSYPHNLFKTSDATKVQPHLGWIYCRKWGKGSRYLILQFTFRLWELTGNQWWGCVLG